MFFEKKISIILGISLISLLTLGSYYYLKPDSRDDAPPSIEIFESGYQGLLQNDLKNKYFYLPDAAKNQEHQNFMQGKQYNVKLAQGVGYYYVNQNTTLKNVLKSINLQKAEGILFIYYSPGEKNQNNKTAKGFHIYPAKLNSNDLDNPINSIQNPDNFVIPAGRAFLLYSLKAGEAYGFKMANKPANYTPQAAYFGVNKGWFMLVANNQNLKTFIANFRSHLSSIFILKNGRFEKVAMKNWENFKFQGNYVLWAKTVYDIKFTNDPEIGPDKSVKITWQETYPQKQKLLSYKIYRNQDNPADIANNQQLVKSLNSTSLWYKDQNLEPDKKYYYAIIGVDKDGNILSKTKGQKYVEILNSGEVRRGDANDENDIQDGNIFDDISLTAEKTGPQQIKITFTAVENLSAIKFTGSVSAVLENKKIEDITTKPFEISDGSTLIINLSNTLLDSEKYQLNFKLSTSGTNLQFKNFSDIAVKQSTQSQPPPAPGKLDGITVTAEKLPIHTLKMQFSNPESLNLKLKAQIQLANGTNVYEFQIPAINIPNTINQSLSNSFTWDSQQKYQLRLELEHLGQKKIIEVDIQKSAQSPPPPAPEQKITLTGLYDQASEKVKLSFTVKYPTITDIGQYKIFKFNNPNIDLNDPNININNTNYYTGYALQQNGSVVNYAFNFLPDGNYIYQIGAIAKNNPDKILIFSNTIQVNVPAGTGSQENLTLKADQQENGDIELTWTDSNSANADNFNYQIFRSEKSNLQPTPEYMKQNGAFVTMLYNGSAKTFTDQYSKLNEATTYYYVVAKKNNNGKLISQAKIQVTTKTALKAELKEIELTSALIDEGIMLSWKTESMKAVLLKGIQPFTYEDVIGDDFPKLNIEMIEIQSAKDIKYDYVDENFDGIANIYYMVLQYTYDWKKVLNHSNLVSQFITPKMNADEFKKESTSDGKITLKWKEYKWYGKPVNEYYIEYKKSTISNYNSNGLEIDTSTGAFAAKKDCQECLGKLIKSSYANGYYTVEYNIGYTETTNYDFRITPSPGGTMESAAAIEIKNVSVEGKTQESDGIPEVEVTTYPSVQKSTITYDPSSIVITGNGEANINLSWQKPVAENMAEIKNYKISKKLTGGKWYEVGYTNTSDPNITIPGLGSPHNYYKFGIQAVYVNDQISELTESDAIMVTDLPKEPTEFKANSINLSNEIYFEWEDTAEYPEKFNVFYRIKESNGAKHKANYEQAHDYYINDSDTAGWKITNNKTNPTYQIQTCKEYDEVEFCSGYTTAIYINTYQ